MPAMTSTTIAGLLKETYASEVPDLIETYNMFWARVKKGDVEWVGPRTLRLPKRFRIGSQFRYTSYDGSSLGRGGGPLVDAGNITAVGFTEACEWTRLADFATANKELAIKKAGAQLMTEVMDELAIKIDKAMHATNAVMATLVSGAGTTTHVLDRTRLLRDGNRYDYYNSALTTKRAGTPSTVTSITQDTLTITIDAEMTAVVNGDKLVYEGLTAPAPAGLFTIPYWHNSAKTGTQGGLNKATYPQLATPEVVASAALSWAHLRLLVDKVVAGRNEEILSQKPVMYCHPAQRRQYESIMQQNLIYEKKSAADTFDVGFDMDQSKMVGFSTLTSPTQSTSRIDMTFFDNWARGETKPIGMYTPGSGNDETVFPLYDNSIGGLVTSSIFYIGGIMQFFVKDPAIAGIISSLDVPADYNL